MAILLGVIWLAAAMPSGDEVEMSGLSTEERRDFDCLALAAIAGMDELPNGICKTLGLVLASGDSDFTVCGSGRRVSGKSSPFKTLDGVSGVMGGCLRNDNDAFMSIFQRMFTKKQI